MGSTHADPQSQNRRRNYLINPSFQWKQACTIAVIVFLTSTIISFVTFGVLHQQARLRLSDPTGYQADVGSVILFFSIGCSAITAGGIGLWSILMTHRLCGPAYVIDCAMQELRDGRFPTLRGLRKKDEFQALYASVSGTVDALMARTRRELETVAEALDITRNAQTACDTDRQSSLQTLVSQLEELHRDLAESLQQDPVKPPSTSARDHATEPLPDHATAGA
jgi:hypothetical protein